jgi:acetolactate synthase I/II/III large subunit
VPGESFLPLLETLPAAGIRVVAARHEGGAAFMAAAAAHLTGRPQIVLATRTVGAANAAIGIHTARADSAPLVALIGGVRREHRGREAFQESDLAAGIGSLAAWAVELERPHDTGRVLAEGIRQLTTGRPGPVLLALPEDVLGLSTGGHAAPVVTTHAGPSPDRADVRQVLKWLAASRRGVIIAGGGVLRARASKRLMTLADALAVPVIASWRRPDVVPNDYPGYLGMTGYWSPAVVRQRLEEADAVLVLGARMSEIATYGYRIPVPGTRWAQVDLEPRHGRQGLPAPSLSITADVARFLDVAWSDLRGAVLDAENRAIRAESLVADRAAFLAASDVEGGEWTGPGVHPGRVVGTLQRLLPLNAVISTDAGNFGGWVARGYRFLRPGTFLGPTSGAMGYGLPAAIAASLVHTDRPVVAVCGDGGLAMTMAELETSVREGARPIVIVLDNRGYGTIRMHQDREGRPHTASDLGPIDFAAVAEACGALGFRVATDAEFEPALREALAARRTAVIQCLLDPSWVSVDEHP